MIALMAGQTSIFNPRLNFYNVASKHDSKIATPPVDAESLRIRCAIAQLQRRCGGTEPDPVGDQSPDRFA
ncbi:hypothetical protein EMIT0P218_20044 [Pseudomonas sp. IT-P218]